MDLLLLQDLCPGFTRYINPSNSSETYIFPKQLFSFKSWTIIIEMDRNLFLFFLVIAMVASTHQLPLQEVDQDDYTNPPVVLLLRAPMYPDTLVNRLQNIQQQKRSG